MSIRASEWHYAIRETFGYHSDILYDIWMITLKTRYQDIPCYITKDGSGIRELMHPAQHGNKNQSLAEAVIPAGEKTQLHRHLRSEELYHITSGQGIMILGEERFMIEPGDTIAILPGTPHAVENRDTEPLKILCCCAPPYSHEDTELL